MPFVLNNKPTCFHKVKVRRTNDAGDWEAFDFTAEFKRLVQPEIDALFTSGVPNDREIVKLFVGWRDVKQPDGSDLPVSEANRTLLLAEPGVQGAVAKAWVELAITGPTKN